jgi:hypothetical protein
MCSTTTRTSNRVPSERPPGHALAPFDPVPSGGYQSRCRRCGRTAWVGPTGLIYSLLPKRCPADNR